MLQSSIILLSLLAGITAFQSPSGIQNQLARSGRYKSAFELGPTARNGLVYEDITLGEGRRILPGDTVYCYYVGSYASGPLGRGRKVFDETCKSGRGIFNVG